MKTDYWTRVSASRVLNRRKMLGLVGGGAGGAVLLAACSGDSSEQAPPTELDKLDLFSPSAGAPQPGGRFLEISGAGNANFNPVQTYSEGVRQGGANVYDRLLTSREDQRRFVLEALDSIETPDPLTVIMKLKPNMTYHDIAPVNGRAVKAADVVATQQYVKDFPAAFEKTFARDYLASAEAPDDRTIVYRLTKPNAYLFSQSGLGNAFGQMIIPPETFDNLATAKQVGSGPYFFDNAQLNVDYLYKKFPRYRDASKGLPYVAEREGRAISDSAAQEAAFRSGQVDLWTTATPTQIAAVPRDMGTRMQLIKTPSFGCRAFQLNMTKGFPWQSDVRVREAFWRLINRQQALDLAESGEGKLGTGLLPVSYPEYQLDAKDTESYYAEDVAKAKQLLSASGFDLNRDYQFFAGNVFVQSEVAQVLQQQFARAGIKSHVDTVAASGAIFQRWTDNDWEIQISQPPGQDTPSQTLRNQHSKGWSDVYRRFALLDPQIDALIEKSEETVDHEENVRLVKQVQLECIKKFSSCYIMYAHNTNRLLSSRVQNYELTQVNSIYRNEMWLKQA